MADELEDFSPYREAIEEHLLSGEELEAVFPASFGVSGSQTHRKAVALTSHRLILCYRQLKRGESDDWTFRSVPFGRIDEVELTRGERFHRDRIEGSSAVTVLFRRQENRADSRVTLTYREIAIAREVHDRILAHILATEPNHTG